MAWHSKIKEVAQKGDSVMSTKSTLSSGGKQPTKYDTLATHSIARKKVQAARKRGRTFNEPAVARDEGASVKHGQKRRDR